MYSPWLALIESNHAPLAPMVRPWQVQEAAGDLAAFLKEAKAGEADETTLPRARRTDIHGLSNGHPVIDPTKRVVGVGVIPSWYLYKLL